MTGSLGERTGYEEEQVNFDKDTCEEYKKQGRARIHQQEVFRKKQRMRKSKDTMTSAHGQMTMMKVGHGLDETIFEQRTSTRKRERFPLDRGKANLW